MKSDTRESHFYVKSFLRTKYSDKNHPGSGYCEDQYRVQQLIRKIPRKFLFWKYWKEEIMDEEIVPSYVWIGLGTLGFDSSNWKSKFSKYIK